MIKEYFKIIKKITGHQLAYGSLVIFIGSIFINAGSYFYHLLMVRFLGPVDYGIFAALISLLYLLFIPAQTINLVIVKFVSVFKAKENFNQIYSLFVELTKKLFVLGVIVFALLSLSSGQIAYFLKIPDQTPIIILGASFIVLFLVMLNRSIMQGLLKFEFLSIVGILEVLLKLLIAVFLVILGFSVTGAIVAILVAEAIVYLISLMPLKTRWLKSHVKEKISLGNMTKYGLPVFFSMISLTSLYSIDIILVKHFFSPLEAGYYSFVAVIGKIVFFASSAVTMVMFPLISERHAGQKHYLHLFYMSGLIILGISSVLILGYFFFPYWVVFLFTFGKPEQYLATLPYLGAFGIFIALYSLCFLFVNFFLSTERVKLMVLPVLAAILQIILIYLFHQNIWQVIFVNIFTLALLLFLLVVSFLIEKKGHEIISHRTGL